MAPQFGLRHILAAMAVLGVVSLVASEAWRGAYWAGGALLALLCLVLTLGLYAAFFLLASLFARGKAPKEAAPFAPRLETDNGKSSS